MHINEVNCPGSTSLPYVKKVRKSSKVKVRRPTSKSTSLDEADLHISNLSTFYCTLERVIDTI